MGEHLLHLLLTVVPSGISCGAVCLTDVVSFLKIQFSFFCNVSCSKLYMLQMILPVGYLLINYRECSELLENFAGTP